MTAFLLGCAIGAIGALVMCCVIAGGRADRRADEMAATADAAKAATTEARVVGRIEPDARVTYEGRLAEAREAYEREQEQTGGEW